MIAKKYWKLMSLWKVCSTLAVCGKLSYIFSKISLTLKSLSLTESRIQSLYSSFFHIALLPQMISFFISFSCSFFIFFKIFYYYVTYFRYVIWYFWKFIFQFIIIIVQYFFNFWLDFLPFLLQYCLVCSMLKSLAWPLSDFYFLKLWLYSSSLCHKVSTYLGSYNVSFTQHRKREIGFLLLNLEPKCRFLNCKIVNLWGFIYRN